MIGGEPYTLGLFDTAGKNKGRVQLGAGFVAVLWPESYEFIPEMREKLSEHCGCALALPAFYT